MKDTISEVGSLEGKLIRIRKEYFVSDLLTSDKTPVTFKSEMLPEFRAAQGKRAAVTGVITYRRGEPFCPVSIVAEEIRVFRERDQPPQLKDLGKIDITGGVPVEEWIRLRRD